MPRPAWVEDLPPREFQLVKDRRIWAVLQPTGPERRLERVATACWWLGLRRLGNWCDQRRSDRQWERAREEVGCSS